MEPKRKFKNGDKVIVKGAPQIIHTVLSYIVNIKHQEYNGVTPEELVYCETLLKDDTVNKVGYCEDALEIVERQK